MFQESRIELPEGAYLYSRIYGSGKPLLMIHGACVDSLFFAELASLMSETNRVYTYDRRGHGRSSESGGEADPLAGHIDDAVFILNLIREETGLRPDILACSAGCNVAMGAASKKPGSAGKILLHEPPAADCLPENDPFHALIEEVKSQVDRGLYSLPLFQLLSCESVFGPDSKPESREEQQYKDRNCHRFIEKEYLSIYRFQPDYLSLQDTDFVIGLGEDSMDTYHGKSCPVLQKRLNCPLEFFPGGHNGARDHPAAFAALIRQLFQTDGREGQGHEKDIRH